MNALLRSMGWPVVCGILLALLIIQQFPQWIGLPAHDIVLREVACLKHLPGRYMLADLLTKNVSRQVFRTLMDLLAAYSRDGVAFHDPA